MSTVVIEARYRTAAITLSPHTVWIGSTISEEMKRAMGAATQPGADARGCSVTIITGRRTAIQTLGLGIAASAIGLVIERTPIAQAALSSALTPQGAGQLNALMQRLAKAPRRRDFKSVPMILTNPEQWDHEALSETLAYKPVPKQAWDRTPQPDGRYRKREGFSEAGRQGFQPVCRKRKLVRSATQLSLTAWKNFSFHRGCRFGQPRPS
jgi:hypothetical protein